MPYKEEVFMVDTVIVTQMAQRMLTTPMGVTYYAVRITHARRHTQDVLNRPSNITCALLNTESMLY